MAASGLLVVGDQPELMQNIIDKSKSLVPGKKARELGPVVDKAACNRIVKYITEAEANGAKLLLDGRDWVEKYPEGYYVGPTIIEHSNGEDDALSVEIFGPVK